MVYSRILLFGAGAIGGYFGGRLAAAGLNIEFVSRGARLRAMQKNGLTLVSSTGHSEHINVKVLPAPEGLYDLIIIAVKSQDTADAAEICKGCLAESGVVLSLQNGVDNVDILSGIFGSGRVLGCAVNSGISVPEPGTVHYKPLVKLAVGAVSEQGKPHEVQLCKMFAAAGVNCTITENLRQALWQKLMWNMAFNPLSAITRATCGDLADNPYSLAVMKSLVAETAAAAGANGIEISEDACCKALIVRDIFHNYKTSALQDVEKNRTPEIEAIMEKVISTADLGMIDAPVSRTIYNLSSFMFDRWFHSFPQLAADVAVVNSKREVLLIERKFPPYGWAIPGGMADLGETIETTAVRELSEETNINIGIEELHLLGVYSDPSRDSRGHTISVIYYAFSDQEATAADDAKNASWFPLSQLPEMAFDHNKVLDDLISRI